MGQGCDPAPLLPQTCESAARILGCEHGVGADGVYSRRHGSPWGSGRERGVAPSGHQSSAASPDAWLRLVAKLTPLKPRRLAMFALAVGVVGLNHAAVQV